MIQAGKNITVAGDPLQKLPLKYLHKSIKNPKPDILGRIQQLRIVRNIDTKQYSILKRQLPYFVCGMFNPMVRRTENFAYTNYFIVDIDHITEKELDLIELRNKIETDNRVVLSFVSPSEDGLKIMFALTERCYDAAIFSLFYKLFVSDFSKKYGLEQVVDSRTSDVTRACFVSYDPEIYYNPEPEKIDLKAFVDLNDPNAMFHTKSNIEKQEEETKRVTAKIEKTDVDKDVISRIKEILQFTPAKSEKPAAFVPDQLEEIMHGLISFITEAGVTVKEIKNISYGKKIKAKIGLQEAEINLFYGKKGFTVVQSPRTGTSTEMNQMLAQLTSAFLMTQ